MVNDNKKENNKALEIQKKMLDLSEEKFQMLFELSPIGMAMVSHSNGDFIEVNQSLLESTGYTKEEFLKLSYWDITPRDYDQQEMEQIEELNQTGKFGPNYKEYIRKDGSRYPIKISGFILTDIDGSKVVWGIIEDISIQRKLEEDLRFSAYHDSLTALPNRRLFYEKFDDAIDRGGKKNEIIGIISMDLDKFKLVNDNYGHLIGDILLQEVSERLLSVTIDSDVVISRVGGDEFIIIIKSIESVDDILTVGKSICSSISAPFMIVENLICITASVGISIFPYDGKDTHVLRKCADEASYVVKRNGGNGYMRYKKK